MKESVEAISKTFISPSGHDFSRAGRREKNSLAASAALRQAPGRERSRTAEGQTSGAKASSKVGVFPAWLKPCPDDGPRPVSRRSSSGFSLAEALVAIAVLSVGVLSLARLVPYATRNDFGSRTDSTGTFIAMRELEQMLAQPWSVTSFTDAGDGSPSPPAPLGGVTATVNIGCNCATAPCTGNAGATLTGVGLIDFTQAQGAAALVGYRRAYTITQAAGNTVKINKGSYEMRWHVTCNVYSKDAGGNVVDGLFNYTVAARPTGNLPGMIAIPANVQAVRMK